uniref:Cytochrome c oxidase subunit 2 n=1 Tax=Bryozoa sp. TaxID=2813608 RepID=A0AAU8L3W1_9BILA
MKWYMLNFQEGGSDYMQSLKSLHDHNLIVAVLILSMVFYSMLYIFFNKMTNSNLISGNFIETIWSILPFMMLLFLIFPSMKLLYLMDESFNPLVTIKSTGHQWYWSYHYSDFIDLEFDSYMETSELAFPDSRLLEADHRMVVPTGEMVRILLTSSDVIHSWSVPSLGLKCDAIPGRLNQIHFTVNRPGQYFGQCSEICGANHSFMPIALEAISLEDFLNWL